MKFFIIFISLISFLIAGNLVDSFPSPLNSLGNTITLNANSQINNTTNHTIVGKTWLNNGGKCDGAACVLSNTFAPSYAFTVDVGTGVDGWATANTTYTTSKQFDGININPGESITFQNDITVKVKGTFGINGDSSAGKKGVLNINGHVTLYVDSFNQNAYTQINISSGSSLTLIANYVNLDTTSAITPSDFICLSKNDLNVNTGVQLKGLLYAGAYLTLNQNVILNGAVTATYTTMNDNAIINYDLGALASNSPFPADVCSVTLDNSIELTFDGNNDGVLETGTLYQPGSTYRVSHIAPGIDGIVTLNSRISNTMGYLLDGTIGAQVEGDQESMMFDLTLRLVNAGTTTTISTPVDLVLTSLDIDGQAGEPYSDGVVFYNPNATFTNAGSKLQPTHYSDHVMYTTRIDARGYNDTTTTDSLYGAGAVYKDVTSIHYQGVVVNNTYSARSIMLFGTRTKFDLFSSLECTSTEGDVIRGTVYTDDNGNDSYDVGETPLPNISVSIYNDNGTAADTSDDILLVTSPTEADGRYNFGGLDSSLSYRIEVNTSDTDVPAGYNIGTTNPLTGVTVVAESITANQNFGFDTTVVVPLLTSCNPVVTSIMPSGSRSDPSNVNRSSVIAFDYDDRGSIGDFATPTQLASASEVGTVWGKAYNPNTKKLYVASFLRRHADLSPDGLGAIYEIDVSDVSSDAAVGNPTLWMNLNSPAYLGSGATLYSSETAANRGLTSPFAPSHDVWGYGRTAREGLGGMDISDDLGTMYVMDLTNRQLLAIDMKTKVVGNRYPVNDPGCIGGAANVRPFGVDYINGDVYIGVTCSAETTMNDNDVNAYVMRLDGNTFTPVVSGATGFKWTSYWSDNAYAYGSSCGNLKSKLSNGYVPLVTNMEIDQNGNMIIGVVGRNSFRFGEGNYAADTGCNNTINGHESQGFILYATPSGSSWVLSPDETWNTDNGDEQHHYKDGIYAHWGSGVSQTVSPKLTPPNFVLRANLRGF